jgi:uncharacterized Zn-binding protein involved in type VI secretion
MSDASKLEQAARVGDPVEHTNMALGAIAGLVGGIALGLVIVGTGGTALAVIATAASVGSTGSAVFGFIGSLSKRTAGDISTGASHVFVGARDLAAARVWDEAGCHDEPIISGCKHIFIENKNASRATDKTRCDGVIEEDHCCPTVHYGGPSVELMPVRYHGELPEWFFWTQLGVSLFSGGYGLPKAIASFRQARLLGRVWIGAKNLYKWWGRGTTLVQGASGALGYDEFADEVRTARSTIGPTGLAEFRDSLAAPAEPRTSRASLLGPRDPTAPRYGRIVSPGQMTPVAPGG